MTNVIVGGFADEALTGGANANRQVLAVAAEALTTGATADRQVFAVATEAMTTGANADRQIFAVSIEVLAPAKLKSQFIGWGVPVRYVP